MTSRTPVTLALETASTIATTASATGIATTEDNSFDLCKFPLKNHNRSSDHTDITRETIQHTRDLQTKVQQQCLQLFN